MIDSAAASGNSTAEPSWTPGMPPEMVTAWMRCPGLTPVKGPAARNSPASCCSCSPMRTNRKVRDLGPQADDKAIDAVGAGPGSPEFRQSGDGIAEWVTSWDG